MQATLDQEVQVGAMAAAEKLAAQKEEQRCRTEALESQIKLQHANYEAQLSTLSSKHRQQVHTRLNLHSHSSHVLLKSHAGSGHCTIPDCFVSMQHYAHAPACEPHLSALRVERSPLSILCSGQPLKSLNSDLDNVSLNCSGCSSAMCYVAHEHARLTGHCSG